MRPRVFPAEDKQGNPGTPFDHPSFNEAAGIPRGRLRRGTHRAIYSLLCFNEAAGIPRGRHMHDQKLKQDTH